MTINKLINEDENAFGLDGSKYWSSNGLANFQVLAQARNPTVRFAAHRAVISWSYVDAFFKYHWGEVKKVHEYREALVVGAPDDFYMPVGRMAYGVIYPGESAKRQADHFLKTVEDTGDVDWTHDRLVVDLELHHNQSPRRITDATNEYGRILKAATGRWPLLYMRYYWLNRYTIVDELYDFDFWYAQYLRAFPGVRYRKEKLPPPNPIVPGRGWWGHQNTDRGDPRNFGVTGKQVIDYDRCNGGKEVVFSYFAFDQPSTPEPSDKEKLDMMYETWKKNPNLH